MPLVAAAVLPHPPLLVPEIAAGAAPELDDLRVACDEAVGRVLAAEPAVVCVVGSAETTTEHRFPYRASFAAWGVPVQAHLGEPAADAPGLPLSVAVGVWLLCRRRRAAGSTTWRVITVDVAMPTLECGQFGARLSGAASVGLLVMGDGSACRNLNAPGYVDPRAEPFDSSVTKALATVDLAALRDLDPGLAAELLVAGRAPWQVLAGAAAGASLTGELHYDRAPYGVQYTVASWISA